MKKLKPWLIGAVIGGLVGAWIGANLARNRPIWSNPFVTVSVADRIQQKGGELLEKGGKSLEKTGKSLQNQFTQ